MKNISLFSKNYQNGNTFIEFYYYCLYYKYHDSSKNSLASKYVYLEIDITIINILPKVQSVLVKLENLCIIIRYAAAYITYIFARNTCSNY